MDEKLGRINLSLLPYEEGEDNKAPPQAIKDVSHLADADPSEFRKGTVSAVQDYGLFVNVEGVDGLLHVSKMRQEPFITRVHVLLRPYAALMPWCCKYMFGRVRVLQISRMGWGTSTSWTDHVTH